MFQFEMPQICGSCFIPAKKLAWFIAFWNFIIGLGGGIYLFALFDDTYFFVDDDKWALRDCQACMILKLLSGLIGFLCRTK